MSKVKYAKGAKSEWDDRTADMTASKVDKVNFSELFEKYIPQNSDGECIEIGSIPGDYLVYFHKEFGYRPTGIDFSENEPVFHKTMKKNGIKDYSFVKGDFFKHKFGKQFDVVSSFGFVEHFDDIEDVLRRHADLVKPGGYLVITLPNFRFLQHIYHYYFDKANLDIHNLKAMRLGYLKRKLKSFGLQELYGKYYGNLKVWREDVELEHKQLRQVHAIHRWVEKHGKKLPTTRLYSPFIVLIYKKPDTDKV